MFKIGGQLFAAEGPAAVRKIARLGAGIFLDLKFHDIPSTVAGAVSAAADLPGIRLINLHALGGLEMMRAATQALGRADKSSGRRAKPKLLAVTILTSLDRAAMRQVGIASWPRTRAVKLARLAGEPGVRGGVGPDHDLTSLPPALGGGALGCGPGGGPGPPTRADQGAGTGD